jgi:hypothetical protein
VLFVVTLILNMISLSLIRKFKEKYKVNTLWLKEKNIKKTIILFMIQH